MVKITIGLCCIAATLMRSHNIVLAFMSVNVLMLTEMWFNYQQHKKEKDQYNQKLIDICFFFVINRNVFGMTEKDVMSILTKETLTLRKNKAIDGMGTQTLNHTHEAGDGGVILRYGLTKVL